MEAPPRAIVMARAQPEQSAERRRAARAPGPDPTKTAQQKSRHEAGCFVSNINSKEIWCPEEDSKLGEPVLSTENKEEFRS